MNEAQRLRMNRQVWRTWIIGQALMVAGLIWVMMSSGSSPGPVRVLVFLVLAGSSVLLLAFAVRSGRRLLAAADPPQGSSPPPTAMVTAVFVIPALLLALLRL
jgi:apolipoprotein N-acyltransferase